MNQPYHFLFNLPHDQVVGLIGHLHGALDELVAPLAVGGILNCDGAVHNQFHLE